MSKMTKQIVLNDNTLIECYQNEYISDILTSTKTYYEIRDLKEFTNYIPRNAIIFDIGANIGNHTCLLYTSDAADE